jgi:hypothetical protein
MIHLQRVADGLVTLGLILILETVGPWAAGIGVVLLWAYALGWREEK